MLNKTILITGGAGFLGSKITEELLNKKYNLIILKNNSLERIKGLLKNSKLRLLNLAYTDAEKYFKKNKIDYIIHTATRYGRSNESVSEIIETNLILPLKLLELAVKFNVKGFINCDTFYNEQMDLRDKEKMYIKTKKDFLSYSKGYIEGKDIKLINMRIEQMYGPADNPTKFMPFVIKKLLSNERILNLTEGKQKRDYIYVEDVVDSFLCVIKNFNSLNNIEEFGIGSGKSVTLKSVVEKIKSITGSSIVCRWGALKYRQGEVMDSRAKLGNNKKIKWKVKININQGLRKTINYYL